MATPRSNKKRKAQPQPAGKVRTSSKTTATRRNGKPTASAAAKAKPSAPRKRHGQSAILSAPRTIQLPERLDSSSAASVLADFKAHRGHAMVVDASKVSRVGAQPLQILISAARTWQSDGCAFSLSNPSSEFIEAAALLGLSNSELSISGPLQ